MGRDRATGGDPAVEPALRSALLWGVVGALTFGVLYQASVLLGGHFDALVLVGGALVVGAVTAALAYVLAGRLHGAA